MCLKMEKSFPYMINIRVLLSRKNLSFCNRFDTCCKFHVSGNVTVNLKDGNGWGGRRGGSPIEKWDLHTNKTQKNVNKNRRLNGCEFSKAVNFRE